MTTYTVRSGDTLTGIARRYGVSIASIANANGIDDINLIETGDTLTIPDAPSPQPVTVDQSGQLLNSAVVLPDAAAPAPSQVVSFDLAEWFRPPKLYFTLAALAAAAYFFSKGKRR